MVGVADMTENNKKILTVITMPYKLHLAEHWTKADGVAYDFLELFLPTPLCLPVPFLLLLCTFELYALPSGAT